MSSTRPYIARMMQLREIAIKFHAVILVKNATDLILWDLFAKTPHVESLHIYSHVTWFSCPEIPSVNQLMSNMAIAFVGAWGG